MDSLLALVSRLYSKGAKIKITLRNNRIFYYTKSYAVSGDALIFTDDLGHECLISFSEIVAVEEVKR